MRVSIWTHSSVLAMAADSDPVEAITARARRLVFKAIENGWSGPPFDPIALAELEGLEVRPRYDVVDARLVPNAGRLRIEFNPERPRARTRYSVAHEIAHTLFPDVSKTIRNRQGTGRHEGDHWQLEVLCDLAAAEILMPVGVGAGLESVRLDIDTLSELQKRLDVSMEALLLRVVRLTAESGAMIAASRIDPRTDSAPSYRVDYSFATPAWRWSDRLKGRVLPADSVMGRCTAVGFTAKGKERWWERGPVLRVECVGAPPFPGTVFPRVLAVVTDNGERAPRADVEYLVGDATSPPTDKPGIVAHVVNDATANWGAGFGKALALRWPAAQEEFRKWVHENPSRLKLGATKATRLTTELTAFHMVAQHGYRPQKRALIRYDALENCLHELAEVALRRNAIVHMPLIGTGHAGGNWKVIAELIAETVSSRGVEVNVYRPPGVLRPIAQYDVRTVSNQLTMALGD